ncbi:MAG: ABC transporter permease [Hamadaea sp.]|nr:ABC transporter permease [Hamadaea sp.]
MLAYLTFELRRMYREPRLIILTVAMPVILFLALGGSIKGETPEKTDEIVAYLMVAWAAYGALLGTFSSGVGVSHERAAGWLRQLRITPLPPASVVITKAIACSLVAIPAVVVLSAVGLARGVDLGAGQYAALVLFLWLGSIPFALVGLAVGFVLPPQLAQPASFLVSFVMAFAGGIFIQIDDLPSGLREVTHWLPSYRFTQAGFAVLQHQAQSAVGWAVIAGWALVFGGLAALAYRRSAAR